VRRSNEAARRLYESAGFTLAGIRPRYYRNPEEDALILWRDDLSRE
jgi:ribosomal-protein-alanine N-acetyltransferase